MVMVSFRLGLIPTAMSGSVALIHYPRSVLMSVVTETIKDSDNAEDLV